MVAIQMFGHNLKKTKETLYGVFKIMYIEKGSGSIKPKL